MKNFKRLQTNQAKAPEDVTQALGMSATALTEVTDCKFIVMENGNILPVLYFDPVYIGHKRRSSALIGTWKAFDSIAPRIGDKILLVEKYNYVEVYPGEARSKKDGIKKPRACPICSSPIWYKDSGTIARCTNSKCGIHKMRRIYRYYLYCCLTGSMLQFNHITVLFSYKDVRYPADIYRLTYRDYMDIGIEEDKAKTIEECIIKNRVVPIQNLYYSIVDEATPAYAIKLGSLVTDRRMWMHPIEKLTKTKYVSEEMAAVKSEESSKLLCMLKLLNEELETRMKHYVRLAKEISTYPLPNKLPLSVHTFVIGDLTNNSRSYIETMIKLNGGRVEVNFKKITWSNVNYVITDGKLNRKDIQEGIDHGTPTLTEAELLDTINKPLE